MASRYIVHLYEIIKEKTRYFYITANKRGYFWVLYSGSSVLVLMHWADPSYCCCYRLADGAEIKVMGCSLLHLSCSVSVWLFGVLSGSVWILVLFSFANYYKNIEKEGNLLNSFLFLLLKQRQTNKN